MLDPCCLAPPPPPPPPPSAFCNSVPPWLFCCAAEVLPVKSGMSGDVTKRGGRWESDFIWNKVR